jgi:hypothetical protein
MSLEPTSKHSNPPGKLFGRSRHSNKPGEPLAVTKETTAWEIYNHKASGIDKEMIKDWNDSLNTLLIFVSSTGAFKGCHLTCGTGRSIFSNPDSFYHREYEAS